MTARKPPPGAPGDRGDRGDRKASGLPVAPDVGGLPGRGQGGMRTPRSRRRRIAGWVAGSLAVVVLLVAAGAGYLYYHLNHNINSKDISGKLGNDRPTDPNSGDENIAVMGSDSRAGTNGEYGSTSTYTTAQSDTLMVVHVSKGAKWATVLSIPRDSYVQIPSCDMGNGQMLAPTQAKINEAFTLGSMHSDDSGGAACAIKTIESITRIHIDHYIVINFQGFKDMTTALGGVPVCLSQPINDTKADLHLPAGKQKIEGEQALGYVRARYSLGDGSDIERIGRQQTFMTSLIQTAKSKISDPVAMYNFLDATTKSITTDFGGLKPLYDFASGVKSIPSSKIDFVTMPNVPRSTVDPSDTANVIWKEPDAQAVINSFIHDQPLTSGQGAPSSASPKATPTTPAAPPPAIPVDVLNGTYTQGLASDAANDLTSHGWKVASTGTASTQGHATTLIEYPPGNLAAAQQLQQLFPGATLSPTGHTALTVTVGTDWTPPGGGGGSGGGSSTQPGQPTPTPTITTKTADQDICASS